MDVIYNIFTSSLDYGLIYVVLALGVFIAYRVLDIADLGAEGVFPLGGAITVLLLTNNVACEIAILITFICGTIMGTLTGLMHTKLKIPSLLAGIITMVSCIPLVQLLNGAARGEGGHFVAMITLPTNARTIYEVFQTYLGIGEWGIIITLLIIVAFICIAMYLFFGTKIGISIRATGKNKVMSQAQGLNTDMFIIIGLALSNGLVALSGSLFSQLMRTSDSTCGIGTIVIALGSILLGEAIFEKRSFKIALISLVTGSLIYQVVLQIAIRVLDT